MRRFFLTVILFFASPVFSFPGLGDPVPEKKKESIGFTPSHIVIVQTDAEHIWGAYYFAINNSFSVGKEFTATLRMPKESIDFQAADGLSNENISILADGVLSVRKLFKPGLSLQGIQFKVPVKKDSDNILTIVPVQDVQQFYIATPQSELLHFSGSGFESGIPPMLAGGNYSGIKGLNISAGTEVKISITGFPGGRRPFFIMGACVGILLLLIAGALTLRTLREETSARGLYD
jgi:hypothetical protein